MSGDLPPGKWTAMLIGPWWPPDPEQWAARAAHWRALVDQRVNEAAGYSRTRDSLMVNQGVTADNLIALYKRNINRLLDHAEKYGVKARANTAMNGAAIQLRERLTQIAADGNRRIQEITDSKTPSLGKLGQVLQVQAECNASAINASLTAVATIVDSTQQVLNAEGIGTDARTWLKARGQLPDEGVKPPPITKEQLGLDDPVGDHGGPTGGPTRGDAPVGDGLAGSGGAKAAAAVGGDEAPVGDAYGAPEPGLSGPAPHIGGGEVHVPSAGGGVVHGPPGLPAGLPAGVPAGLSPESLGQSFAHGVSAGQPAAAGLHSLSSGAINGEIGSLSHPPPPAMSTPIAPVSTHVGGSPLIEAPVVEHAHVGAVAAVPASVDSGAGAPMAPVMGAVGPAPLAPVAAPSAPVGPLPAFGSDLRPPVVAAPPVSAVASPPLSGVPVSPSAGAGPVSPLVSPSGRSAAAAAGTAKAAPLVGATASAGAAGAAAGELDRQVGERRRLQRIVDAVARQAPMLAWAAGLREDGSTLLVTDVACGWIPPNVRLPAGVNILAPAVRRLDMSPVQLLGGVGLVASHEPMAYVAEPDSEAPALTGERARHGRDVPELGPTLVDIARHCDGLKRLVVTGALFAGRGGLADNEREMLAAYTAEYGKSVLAEYPAVSAVALRRWMVAAAVGALLDGHRATAAYHVAWISALMK